MSNFLHREPKFTRLYSEAIELISMVMHTIITIINIRRTVYVLFFTTCSTLFFVSSIFGTFFFTNLCLKNTKCFFDAG